MGCVENWRGLHVDLHPTHSRCRRTRTALARRNARDAVVADEAGKAVWEGRPAGWGGWQGGVKGGVGWGVGSGGGPGGRRGMDLKSNECSGLNIVT